MKKTLLFGFIWLFIYGFFFFLVGEDPFFGDAISGNSRAAWNIYESHFSEFLFPEGYDPGHPVLIPFLNALLWKIFNPSLWLSHAINFLFSLAILYFTFKLSKIWFNEKTAYWSVSILATTPLFVAQTAMMNAHLPLTFFVLLMIYFVEKKSVLSISLAASGMLLTHLQSIYFLVPILLFYFYQSWRKGWIKSDFSFWGKSLIIPASLFMLWITYHYTQTGWALSSPDYSAHRGFPGLKRVIINLILSDWRIIDFGLVALIIPLFWNLLRKGFQTLNKPARLFIVLFLFNTLAISVTTGTGPAHRYFLPCLPFLIMWAAQFLRNSSWLKVGIIISILFSGHFWFYPGKIIGDGTLAYRSIFPLLENFYADYPNQEAHSYAPLGNSSKWTYLKPIHPDIKSLYKAKIQEANLVLKSNVSGDFRSKDNAILKNHFEYHSYEKGYIYLNVYVNKKNAIGRADTVQRKPTTSEIWMQNLKHKIKGDSGM